MCWAEFLARIILDCDLDPLMDLPVLVRLAQESGRGGLCDLTEEEVEEWLSLPFDQPKEEGRK